MFSKKSRTSRSRQSSSTRRTDKSLRNFEASLLLFYTGPALHIVHHTHAVAAPGLRIVLRHDEMLQQRLNDAVGMLQLVLQLLDLS
eukprot:2911654-Prymnesium_polylepis.1